MTHPLPGVTLTQMQASDLEHLSSTLCLTPGVCKSAATRTNKVSKQNNLGF